MNEPESLIDVGESPIGMANNSDAAIEEDFIGKVSVKAEPNIEIEQCANSNENQPIDQGNNEENDDGMRVKEEPNVEVKGEPIKEEVSMRRFTAREVDSDLWIECKL